MDNNQKAILKTLLYSSLFSFPLTEEELYRYLIHEQNVSRAVFKKSLRSLSSQLIKKNGYYTLKNNTAFIGNRIAMHEVVHEKQQIAKQVALLLSKIPTIYFIGLSGGLASGSAKKEDDIDFFIITKKNTMFISRLLALLILQLVGRRRTVRQTKASDKVCLNMWVDTTRLQFPKSQRDVYIAREIAQLKPLCERKATYKIFLTANAWVAAFLPHAFVSPFVPEKQRQVPTLLERIMAYGEPLSRFLQMLVIRRHITVETVTDHYLAFHPTDYRKYIMTRFLRLITQEQNYYK